MTSFLPWGLCILLAVWLRARGLRIRSLEALVKVSGQTESKANDDRIAAEARADVLGRRVGEWSRVAAENDARAGQMAAKAAELAGERDRLREEVATLASRVYGGDRPWVEAIAAERAKAHPSGAVVRALDGVERKVRGGA